MLDLTSSIVRKLFCRCRLDVVQVEDQLLFGFGNHFECIAATGSGISKLRWVDPWEFDLSPSGALLLDFMLKIVEYC